MTTDLQIRRAYAAVETAVRRRLWRDRPDLWCKQRANKHIWSKQRQIMESVRDNRKTACQSCHGAGKSFDAALLVCWWTDTHEPGDARSVTTAPTNPQVKGILWQYIRDIHAEAGLLGRTNLTEWLIDIEKPNGRSVELQVAFGRKPSDMNPTAFQGIHGKAVLIIFDEADGIAKALWSAAIGLMSNDACRILAIGNPDNADSQFAVICKAGSGWVIIVISVFDTPYFTGEEVPAGLLEYLVGPVYVEECMAEWAPNWRWNKDRTKVIPPAGVKMEDALKDVDPFWCSKVLGIFPSTSGPQSLIRNHWIVDAQERDLAPGAPIRLGVDVGGGGDASTTCLRRGDVYRIISEDRNPNTMETCGKVVEELTEHGAEAVYVDRIGIGAGITNRGQELGLPFVGINVGEAAPNPEKFLNLRAENWWNVRQLFEEGRIDIDPRDQKLAKELSSIRFKRTSNGKIQIESKEEARKRKVPSPNRADSLMLVANNAPVVIEERTKVARAIF